MALQLGLEAVTLAACYALLALGFVLILNATGAVNFSQGDLVMLGGFAAAWLGTWLGLPGIVLLPLLLVLMAALGLAVALLAWFPLRRRPPETVFIATIAIGVMLENGATLVFGPEPRAAPPVLGARLQSPAIVAVAVILVLGLYLIFAHTRLGRRLRAAAEDPETAAALGVRVRAMVAVSFALGGALAGAAGLLLANRFFVTADAGGGYMLKAYVAAVIGGWGSLPGAVAGAALLAAFDVLWPSLPLLLPHLAGLGWMFSQNAATIALDLAILAILGLRPQGLFGRT